jgi:multiple sugar transport system substrate-binding protein
LILLYRPATIPEPPLDWTATLALDSPLIFPAGDERALFTLLQYLSADGKIQDNEGLPMLDEKTLTDVLTFYQQAEQAGVMPVWLTQFSSDDQAWKAYGEGRANLIVTWASRYLNELPADTAAVPVPTATGTPLTLADGWVWALSNPQTDNRALTVELAQFLTDSDFLARWTSTAGYLPPRASALAGWSSPALQSLVDQIVHSAQIIPSADVLIALSPALGEATLNVLKEQADPAEAAQSAVARLSGP